MRVAFDSNILVYAEAVNGEPRASAADELIERIPAYSVIIPVQALGELFNVLVRRAHASRAEARSIVSDWERTYVTAPTTQRVLQRALELAVAHQFQIWDAIILAAAAEAECSLLLTEDLHDGFTWNGVTVANPFSPVRQPLLEAFLRDAGAGS